MFSFFPLFFLFFTALAVRTAFWHAQSWQLREYRFDRMKAWLQTEDGRFSLRSLWFFKGILPRPRFTMRALLVLGLSFLFSALVFCVLWKIFGLRAWFTVFLLERLQFLTVFCANMAVMPLQKYKSAKIFRQVSEIRANLAENITIIAITGSFGKSSTKNIIRHLLESEFGTDNVLCTPKNINTELGVAHFLLKNRAFLEKNTENAKKFVIVEMGAYKKGEIALMCEFVRPHIGILTGIGVQHIELFGSQTNIVEAKTELAHSAEAVTIFNGESELLESYFQENGHLSVKKAVVGRVLEASHASTVFEWNNHEYVLPWSGAFYTQNAVLGLELGRYLGISLDKMQNSLKNTPVQANALHVSTHKKGFSVLLDPYSANFTGIMAALEHLSGFSGQKVVVSLPLRELGEQKEGLHTQIFEKIKEIDADLFWPFDDFTDLAKDILGPRFLGANLDLFRAKIMMMTENDAVLLESRLPKAWEAVVLDNNSKHV